MRLKLALALLAVAATAAAGEFVRDDLSAEDRARVQSVTEPTTRFDAPERFETMQGGATTTAKVGDANALSRPSANLSFEGEQRFAVGNGLFRKDWVTAPASTQASDGLGPLFNARACQACHIKDGRGHAPADDDDNAVSLLVRLSVPPDELQVAQIAAGRIPAAPHPVYGLQLQDNAAAGLRPEGRISIRYDAVTVDLAGGETVELRRPALAIANPGYGPLGPEVMTSARIAPPMTGMGLLDAIHPADILARADPDDADGDGISGRANMVGDGKGGLTLGRFGWKAVEPTLESQIAHAFSGDMGLSTPLAPHYWGECTAAQIACRAMPHGAQAMHGPEEVPGRLFDLVAFYSRHLAPPVRRDTEDPDVLRGKSLFYGLGCTSCHTPKYVTRRDVDDPSLRFQLIWPYTDLLLHDMGEGLADGRSEGLANGREWRTPPLWGIGVAKQVSAEAGFLHDGRARTIKEAILWHGGEAQAARDGFAGIDREEREALIRFVESL